MHRSLPTRLALLVAAAATLGFAPEPPAAGEDPRPRLERRSSSGQPRTLRDVVDSQGNRYKVDEEGNIYTNGIPNVRRQPASAENVEFYYNYAIDMMNRGYTAPALELYREILALPPKNDMVVAAQKLVRANYDEVRNFNLKNQNLDIQDLVFVVRHIDDGRVVYDNERYRFRVRYPVNWKVDDELRNADDQYAGLTLYPLEIPGRDGEKVTVAIGIRAEMLPDGMTLERFRQGWVARLQQADQASEKLAGLKRQTRPSGPDRLRDHFEVQMESRRPVGDNEVQMEPRRFVGDELFVVRGRFGYYLTFTATPETYETAREIFDRFVSEFEVLP